MKILPLSAIIRVNALIIATFNFTAATLGVTFVTSPAFEPNIPSSAAGAIYYEYTFSGHAEADVGCGGECWEGPYSCGFVAAKTSHYGTVGGAVVRDGGSAELFGDCIQSYCPSGASVERLTYCSQSMNGLTTPVSFVPSETDYFGICRYDNGEFYGTMNYGPNCETTVDEHSGTGWSIKVTRPASLPCSWFFMERTCSCNYPPTEVMSSCEGPWTFWPMAVGQSGYFKLVVEAEQGVTPPSLASLGISIAPLGMLSTLPYPSPTSPPITDFPTNTPPPTNKFFNLSQVVSCGKYHTLAIKRDRTVWAWGRNNYSQLGDGTYSNRSVPGQVAGLSNVIAVACGDDHSLALRADGTVWGWGQRTVGQVGDGSSGGVREQPYPVVGLSNILSIAAGKLHSLALKSDGTVWSWGFNASGQLGIGVADWQAHPVPSQVTNMTNVVQITAGTSHSMFVKADGTVWGCGQNGAGQLGDFTYTSREYPVQFTTWSGPLTNALNVAAGSSHTSVLLKNGIALIRGYCGQEDEESETPCFEEPLPFSNLSNIVAISSSADSLYALKNDLTVWSWANGFNSWERIASQVNTTALPHTIAIAGGSGVSSHFLAITPDLKLRSWGSNTYGQLGDGTTTDRTNPVALSSEFGF